jgi:hypothetical protein
VVELLPEGGLRIEGEPPGERAVELLDRPLLVEHQARQWAGLEHARQVVRAAGQRQPVPLALQRLAALLGLPQRGRAQRRGKVRPARRGVRDGVDQGRQPDPALVRHFLEEGPELGLELDRGPDLAEAHGLADHALALGGAGAAAPFMLACTGLFSAWVVLGAWCGPWRHGRARVVDHADRLRRGAPGRP